MGIFQAIFGKKEDPLIKVVEPARSSIGITLNSEQLAEEEAANNADVCTCHTFNWDE